MNSLNNSIALPTFKSGRPVRVVWRDRMSGHYRTEETQDENEVCLRRMAPKDVCYSLNHALGRFGVMNKTELFAQMKAWKKMGAVLRDCNIVEREVAGKTVWAAVIQPSNEEDLENCNLCPLGSAMGILVTGYTYVFVKRDDVDFLAHYLSK
jgi:hypothetical protein